MPAGGEKFWDVLHESTWTWIGLAFAIGVLVWLVVRIRAWVREDDDPAEDAQRMLSEVREMYREGDVSQEEYRSIKRKLSERMDGPPADAGD